MDAFFDATAYTPNQGGSKHPAGDFPFMIAATKLVPTKSNDGMRLIVTFNTPQGTIENGYNIHMPEDKKQSERIGREQLSALCYATGILRINLANGATELINGRGTIKIGDDPANPQYSRVVLVMDQRGELPKAGATAQSPAPMAQPSPPQNPAAGQFGGGAPQNPNVAMGFQQPTQQGFIPPQQPGFNGGAANPAQPQWAQPAGQPAPAFNQPGNGFNPAAPSPPMPAWAQPKQ